MADFTENTDEINSCKYLYTFSDDKIIDIIANPKEWTEVELEVAKKIVDERGLSKFLQDIDKEKMLYKQAKIARRSSFCFLLIAALWVVEVYLGGGEGYLFGFGVAELGCAFISMRLSAFFGHIFSAEHSFLFFTAILPVILVVFFFQIWRKSYVSWKKGRILKPKLYRIGMIVYGIDLLLLLLVKPLNPMFGIHNIWHDIIWSAVVFHLIMLLVLYRGYRAMKASMSNQQ